MTSGVAGRAGRGENRAPASESDPLVYWSGLCPSYVQSLGGEERPAGLPPALFFADRPGSAGSEQLPAATRESAYRLAARQLMDFPCEDYPSPEEASLAFYDSAYMCPEMFLDEGFDGMRFFDPRTGTTYYAVFDARLIVRGCHLH